MTSINTKPRIRPDIFLLIGIILFFAATNVIWLAIDTAPPPWDDSIHMKLSTLYSRFAPQAGSIEAIKNILSLSSYYPPFFHISAIPIIYIFGFNEDYLTYINFFYLVILVFSIYGIGKTLFNARVGIFSALLTLLYPVVFALSRRYMLDFALVSMVCLVHYIALQYHEEDKAILGFLLVITMISAGLVKQTAQVFFIPTIMLLFFRKWLRNKIFWVILLSVFLMEGRYFHKIIELFSYKGVFSAAKIIERVSGNFIWYMSEIGRSMVSNFLFLFFLIGFFSSLIFSRKKKALLILSSWIIGAFFLLSFIRWKDARYAVAVLPAFALITIGGVDALSWKAIKKFLVVIFLCLGLVQFFSLSFRHVPFFTKGQDFFYNRLPLKQDWKVKEIINYISNRFQNKTILIGMLPNCEFFNHDELILYITLNKLPYSVWGLFFPEEVKKQLKDCDVAITKEPFSSAYYNKNESDVHERLINEMLNKEGFRNIKSFDLPDKSNAVIYEKY